MTQPLNDFISSVRLAPSLDDERYIVSTEQAQIRAYLRKIDPDLRPRIVSKIVFLDMIGENPAWGQMESLTLMTHDRFSFKRVGYICASILLNQTSDLTVLVTQTLLSDLSNPQPNIVYLALTFIANLGSCSRSCSSSQFRIPRNNETCWNGNRSNCSISSGTRR
jgi:hypothetical protein